MDANSPTTGSQVNISTGNSVNSSPNPLVSIPASASFPSAAFLYATQLASSFVTANGTNPAPSMGFGQASPSVTVLSAPNTGDHSHFLTHSHHI